MSRAFYCEEEGEPPCAGVVALRARIAELEEYAQAIDAWCRSGEVMVEREGNSILFRLGEWWAERPWKKA